MSKHKNSRDHSSIMSPNEEWLKKMHHQVPWQDLICSTATNPELWLEYCTGTAGPHVQTQSTSTGYLPSKKQGIFIMFAIWRGQCETGFEICGILACCQYLNSFLDTRCYNLGILTAYQVILCYISMLSVSFIKQIKWSINFEYILS